MGGQGMGFHGKMPARGDFVRRRVSGDFLGQWDPWLEQCMHRSRQSLGEGWLEAYLTSPIWRFAMSPGVCGTQAVAGVLMPSVDAVGRYYPFTLVLPLAPASALLSLAVEAADWFDAVEKLALSVLDGDESFDLDGFDQAVLDLGRQVTPRVASDDSHLFDRPQGPLRLRFHGLDDLSTALLALQQAAACESGGIGLWWTDGSERIEPCVFLERGLPRPEQFAALIDGEWRRHGWDTRPLRWQSAGASAHEARTADSMTPPDLRSAAVSHAGKVRRVNEDAWLDRCDAGLWAVADGVGGQAAGDMASRSVVDSLRSLGGGGDLQRREAEARSMLALANDHLIHAATRPDHPVKSASTVVVLLAGVGECCWLWAGDSRLYRLRDGELNCCTRDHSLVQELVDNGQLAPEEAHGHPQSNVIHRAVGADEELEVDCRYGDLRPGDRFLLCSDGVHGSVDDATLVRALSAESPQAAADGLLAAVLEGPAKDNCTAVVVFCD